MNYSPPRSPRVLLGAVFAFVFACFLFTDAVRAQGFGVYEQGTCVMGRAGATVATGCGDGSSIFFNPANLAGMEPGSFTGSLGATIIDASGDFTYDSQAEAPSTGRSVDLTNDPIPVPHGYFSYGLSERVSAGLGIYVPYGLETNWPTELSSGEYFDGAFEGFENRVQSIYIQPTIGIQASERLRVGFGPIIAVSSVELNQLQDLSQVEVPSNQVPQGTTFGNLGVPFHTAFARSKLEGKHELGFGLNLGASFQATERLRIGGRFMSPITVSYDGTADFEQISTGLTFPASSPLAQDLPTDGNMDGNPDPTPADILVQNQFSGNGQLTEQDVQTQITFPMQIVGGVSFQATEKLLLLADYQFTQWSEFDTIPLQFEKLGDQSREENYGDTHAIRLGAEYDVLDQLTARIGYLHNTEAAPDDVVTPLLPENNRNQFTIGAGWRPIDVLEVNASYQLLQQNDRRGRVRGPVGSESISTDLNQGLYSFGANLFATTITVRL
jgi:long-chain fatty acid transport protein